MTTTFSCTMCGRCCHGLRLPLGVEEAMAWLDRGGAVELFCEAIPWPEEPPADNALAAHKRRRSFAAISDRLPVRVIVTLMATFPGACPNLQADMRCGIYADRPRACRVYPAEVNPHIPLDPAGKLCPPEAWQTNALLQNDAGEWVDPEVRRSIQGMREADTRDAITKARLCALLHIDVAGLSNEAVVIHAPERAQLAEALATAAGQDPAIEPAVTPWTLASHRVRTRKLLASASSHAMDAARLDGPGVTFLPFVPGDPI